ncbi:hypothetical protein [Corynebacterium sp.]|uniref:hypothetical protein n=1 Tax=Corynebacterium sp. TaxID=1720 RepID=UPI0026DCD318|nr:hypothetical protein [Corynebacterium sp.]MDO4609742.1 hypothetical protein [Corynebacterium sp.]
MAVASGEHPSGSYYYASESKDGKKLELEATQDDDDWWYAENGSYTYWVNPREGLQVFTTREQLTDEPAIFGILNAG